MVIIWQFWEFEYTSKNIIRVIDVSTGLELFAIDVFQIIAPELNEEKVVLLNIKTQERCVIVNHEVVTVKTLNALAIHGLIGVVEADVVREFMQWVRTNIRPIFQKDFT